MDEKRQERRETMERIGRTDTGRSEQNRDRGGEKGIRGSAPVERVFDRSGPSGIYRDLLCGPDGRVIEERPWRSNLIVDSLPMILSYLVRGNEYRRLDTWAVGSGLEEWDSHSEESPTIPGEAERARRESLYRESARVKVEIDGVDVVTPGQLRIEASFTMADFAAVAGDPEKLRLREFSLIIGGYPGDNNSEQEPGREFLVNHVVHPRIDMQEGLTLRRTLILTF